MHTAFSSPSSAPAAPLMPVSDTVHERFIRLPEVMHLCGLSRSTIYDLISREAFPKQISLGGKNVAWASLKSLHGWRIALPNVTGTMTHDDDRSAPFSGLLLFAVSRYSFSAVAKSAAGRENPSYSVATPDAPCVFLCRCPGTPVVYEIWFLRRSLSVMVAQAGQPSGWPVPIEAGFLPVWATTRA